METKDFAVDGVQGISRWEVEGKHCEMSLEMKKTIVNGLILSLREHKNQ